MRLSSGPSVLRRLGIAGSGVVALGVATALAAQVIDARAPRSESEAVAAWIDEARTILRSEALISNLALLDGAYDTVELTDGVAVAEPSELAAYLRLSVAGRPRLAYAPVTVQLTGTGVPDPSWDSGYGNSEDANASVMPVNDRVPGLRMRLGRVHYDRYVNGNQVERSCAINTMAHEMVHTLTDTPGPPFRYLFTDNNTAASSEAATLLIGSVAQCTFLRNAGRIVSDAAFVTCVERFGTVQPFRSNACNDYPDGAPFP